jgi:hypothetical protein
VPNHRYKKLEPGGRLLENGYQVQNLQIVYIGTWHYIRSNVDIQNADRQNVNKCQLYLTPSDSPLQGFGALHR